MVRQMLNIFSFTRSFSWHFPDSISLREMPIVEVMGSLKHLQKKSRLLHEALYALLPFLAVWIIDRVSKNWAEALPGAYNVSALHFNLVYNHGIMMGWLSHLPIHVKTTIIATMGAVIFSSYVLVLAVAPIHSKWLRAGLSMLAGGIIGNVTDRLIGFAVVDFVSLSFSNSQTPFYNLADIFQWFGYLFIGYGIYEDSVHWWPTQDFRNKTLIKPGFQLRAGVLLGMMNFLVGLIFMVFGFAFFKEDSNTAFISYYFICGLIILTFLTLAGFIVGIIISHRAAGPVYALEKYLNDSLNGTERPFKLRKNDEFKELEDICTRLNSKINKR